MLSKVLFVHKSIGKVAEDEVTVDFCMYADLSDIKDKTVVLPIVTCFLESLEVVTLGSQQINGFKSDNKAILELLSSARHSDMPVIEWAGFNKAFPMMQGVNLGRWSKAEEQILKAAHNEFREGPGAALDIQNSLKVAGFDRSTDSIDTKRLKLGLIAKNSRSKSIGTRAQDQEDPLQRNLAIAVEIEKAVQNVLEGGPGAFHGALAQRMCDELQKQGIYFCERLCQRMIRIAAPGVQRSAQVLFRPFSIHESGVAQQVWSEFQDKSDHPGMAKILRDRLNGSRNILGCQKYFDNTFPDDLKRRANWAAWEYEAIDYVRDQNPKAGLKDQAELLERYIREKYGEKMLRSRDGYLTKVKKYKSGSDNGKKTDSAKTASGKQLSVKSQFLTAKAEEILQEQTKTKSMQSSYEQLQENSTPEAFSTIIDVQKEPAKKFGEEISTSSTIKPAWNALFNKPQNVPEAKKGKAKKVPKRSAGDSQVWAGAGFTKKPKTREE